MNGHTLLTPETCPCEINSDLTCMVCVGGLSVCAKCGAAESELECYCLKALPFYGIIEHTKPEPTQSELITRPMILKNLDAYLADTSDQFRIVRMRGIIMSMIWREDAYKLYKDMFLKMS